MKNLFSMSKFRKFDISQVFIVKMHLIGNYKADTAQSHHFHQVAEGGFSKINVNPLLNFFGLVANSLHVEQP